uniref:proline-rich receptor-like protein kinase PERK8 n=1 Tax=Monopterus albus TaxID=43700 RepID=UPI0009B3AF35|nr:proline-rich receptor-like protein kinase PERK8 [Monopterus albus]
MPHMEEVPYNSEESYNPSFSLSDEPGVYTYKDLPCCQGPVPLRMTDAPATSFVSTESGWSPVIFSNNVFTPTKCFSSSPTFNIATVDMSPTYTAQDAAPPQRNLSSLTPPPDTTLDPTSPSPATHDTPCTPPSTCPDSQITQTVIQNEPPDPVSSPSSQTSLPRSQSRIALAEIDKPFRKPHVKTPPYSPLLLSSIPKQMSTPPPTREHSPWKTKLVYIDTSPLDAPPVTPAQTAMTLSTEADQPSTSLDQTDPSEYPGADAGSPSQDRGPSTNLKNTQDGHRVWNEDDDGFLKDEDADKNSEGSDGADDRIRRR